MSFQRLGFCILLVLAPQLAYGNDTTFVLPSGNRVEGVRLSDLSAMAAQAERVRRAVMASYHVEIGAVPIHVVSIEDIRALHKEIGGRLRSGWQLHGFELDGHVFVRRGLGGVTDEVLIHECLHALSRRFSNEAHAHGIERLVEGVTQLLTLAALAARPGTAQLRTARNRTYVGSTEFAETLSTLVGASALSAAYLSEGYIALAVKVDAITGGRRRLDEAAHLLDGGDEPAALRHLTSARRRSP